MGRKSRTEEQKKITFTKSTERKIKKGASSKLEGFDRALSSFRKRNAEKALSMLDKDVMKLYAKKNMPSLEAAQEDWDKLFKKF